MSGDDSQPIEELIAHWLESGEGEEPLLAAIDAAIQERRGRLAARFGEQIADDVVDAGAFHVWRKLKAGRFDASRSFGSWLVVVLKNRCRDALKKAAREPISFTAATAHDERRSGLDVAAPPSVVPQADRAGVFRDLAAEIDRIPKPDYRIIFAVASGLADHLPAEQIDSWCRAHDQNPEFRRKIAALLAVPIHGRQVDLAAVFGIRGDACRKRYERATTTLLKLTTDERLRRLISDCIQRRDPPAS